MNELEYIITKAKEQIAKLEDSNDHNERRTILEYLRVIRDAVYTKDQIGEKV